MRLRSLVFVSVLSFVLASCGSEEAPSVGETIRAGDTREGALDPNDEVFPTDGSFYDLYTFLGEPGERIEITLASGDFDAYLAGGPTPEAALRGEDDDDDGAGGTDARLFVRADINGRYVIRANSLRGGETGAYTLTVRSPDGAMPEAASGLSTLRAGEPVTGRLERGDDVLADESLADLWVYEGEPGERVAFTLASGDFDAFLTVGTISGDDLEPLARDDDGGGGTNARLSVVNDDGFLAVQANSFGPGETGAYTLTAEKVSGGASTSARFPGRWGPVAYQPTDQFANVRRLVQGEQRLEETARGLSSDFPLPDNVSMTFADCGEPNAFYDPQNNAIAFCYELVAFFEQALSQQVPRERLVEAARGAYEFVILHEAGHALTDQLDLPITGREEDVADQFAALHLIRQGTQGAWAAIYGVLALNTGSSFMDSDFADEHSLGPVRLFNVACLVYGSDPEKYSDLVGGDGLPRERAVRCPAEYQQVEKSFDRLLGLVYSE